MKKRKVAVFDIETFKNTFSMVAYIRDTKKFLKFIIHEDGSKYSNTDDLYLFLSEKPMFVGYNCLGFDGQIIQLMWDNYITDARKIYEASQDIIENKNKPYKPWHLYHDYLDLQAINNYTIYGKATSLKWLEFTTRQKSIADLPYNHTKELKTETHLRELLSYNKKDVVMTNYFMDLCRKAIDMRTKFSKLYDDKMIMNNANSSIGEKIVINTYCDITGIPKNKIRNKLTRRKEIAIKDVFVPYLKFKTPLFNEVKEDFAKLVLKADKKGVIKIKKAYEKEIIFQNMTVKYALGGIHGCVTPGIYSSDDKYIIRTTDVAGMYPNFAVANNVYPKHLGEMFIPALKVVIDKKESTDKYEDPENYAAYKEGGNSVYGKSNAAKDNPLKDPAYTVTTTVNGQLLITMLGEQLSEFGEFIMWNTDGLEVKIPREMDDEYLRICDEWCKLTGMRLEHDTYETMWVRDVNNYIGKFTSGKIKRKGAFCIYEDYINNWDKNPSALIIPQAVNDYFVKGTDVYNTILGWENIHDFLIGMKGGSTSEYWMVEIENNVIENISKETSRAIRYYISKNGKSLLKNWISGKKVGDLPSAPPGTKGQSIKLLMSTMDSKGLIYRTVKDPETGEKIKESRYPDLDYEYYAREALKWIHNIENNRLNDEEE